MSALLSLPAMHRGVRPWRGRTTATCSTSSWRPSALARAEARNGSVLIHLLLEEGIEPGVAVGDLYREGLAIREWRERVKFLAHGERRVADRIAAAMPRLSSSVGRRTLQAVYDSHLVNLGICEQHLKL